MIRPTVCICKNKDTDQLRKNCEADQRLRFRYMDSTILILFKSKNSIFNPASVLVQLGFVSTLFVSHIVVRIQSEITSKG